MQLIVHADTLTILVAFIIGILVNHRDDLFRRHILGIRLTGNIERRCLRRFLALNHKFSLIVLQVLEIIAADKLIGRLITISLKAIVHHHLLRFAIDNRLFLYLQLINFQQRVIVLQSKILTLGVWRTTVNKVLCCYVNNLFSRSHLHTSIVYLLVLYLLKGLTRQCLTFRYGMLRSVSIIIGQRRILGISSLILHRFDITIQLAISISRSNTVILIDCILAREVRLCQHIEGIIVILEQIPVVGQ